MSATDSQGLAADGRSVNRILALDGLRGVATLMVLLSHFFAEIRHGWGALGFGWLGVDIFFVMSGYLVGKLVIERRDSTNFFLVFYVRRFLRTVPSYILVVVAVFGLAAVLGKPAWMEFEDPFPLWSYLSFTQNFLMASENRIGPHWLAPSWTLSVEEHFYLVIPVLLCFVPLRRMALLLSAVMVASAVFRLCLPGDAFAIHVLLPGRMDQMAGGILLAVLLKGGVSNGPALQLAARIAPVLCLSGVCVITLIGNPVLSVLGRPLMILGCVALLYCLIQGAPEARRFEAKPLLFIGSISYGVYLTHLPILGLVHGVLLGQIADLGTPAQLAATILAIPVAILVGWVLTKLVEEPLTIYGRRWRWRSGSQAEPVGVAKPEPLRV